MSEEERKVIQEIKDHIIKCGGVSSVWYVGIAQDPRSRLFNDHAVDQKSDAWIFRKVSSSNVARNIEQYLIETLRTDGDVGGGDENTNSVYAYKKNSHTNQ